MTKAQAIAEYIQVYQMWRLGDASAEQVMRAERAALAAGATMDELDRAIHPRAREVGR